MPTVRSSSLAAFAFSLCLQWVAGARADIPPPAPDPPPPPARRDANEQGIRAISVPFGFLTVQSDVVAFVDLDGVRLGTTPLVRRPVPPGRHRILLRGRTCNGTFDTVVTVAPRVEVIVQRDALCRPTSPPRPPPSPPPPVTPPTPAAPRAQLTVRAERDAEVLVDGRVIGRVPVSSFYVDAGTHVVALRGRCGRSRAAARTRVTLRPGEQRTVVLRICGTDGLPQHVE